MEILIDITHLVHTSFDTRESARIPKKRGELIAFSGSPLGSMVGKVDPEKSYMVFY